MHRDTRNVVKIDMQKNCYHYRVNVPIDVAGDRNSMPLVLVGECVECRYAVKLTKSGWELL